MLDNISIYLKDTFLFDGAKDITSLGLHGGSPPARIFQEILDRYINVDSRDKIAVIYGLKNTGKKTCVRQLANYLSNSVIIHIENENTRMSQIMDICQYLFEKNIVNFFIENITLVPDFIRNSRIFSKYFSDGKYKFIFTGDQNYSFLLAGSSELLFALDFFYTKHIHCNITDEYINEAILDNIKLSIKNREYSDYSKHFKTVLYLCEKNKIDFNLKSLLITGKSLFYDDLVKILSDISVLKYENKQIKYIYPELEKNLRLEFQNIKFNSNIYDKNILDMSESQIVFLAYKFIHDYILETDKDLDFGVKNLIKVSKFWNRGKFFDLAVACCRYLNDIDVEKYLIKVKDLVLKDNLKFYEKIILMNKNKLEKYSNKNINLIDIWLMNYISKQTGITQFTYQERFKIAEIIIKNSLIESIDVNNIEFQNICKNIVIERKKKNKNLNQIIRYSGENYSRLFTILF